MSGLDDISMNDYQDQAEETALYAGKESLLGLTYNALAVAGEAGEVAGKVSKIIRDELGSEPNLSAMTIDNLSEEIRQTLIKECGDVLWHIAQLALELDAEMGMVALRNLEKLRSRAERGVISGSGDDR